MKLLIVIDMQNDFIGGALGTKVAVAIVPNVAKKIADARAAGAECIILVSIPEYGLLYLSGSVLQYFLSYQFQLNSRQTFQLPNLHQFHRPAFHLDAK